MRRSSSALLFAALAAAGFAAMTQLAAGRGGQAQAHPAGEAAAPADPWTPPAEPLRSALLYDRFETIGVKDGLPSERTTCVLAEGEDLAVGTDAGLALRRAGKWTVLTEKDGLAHRYVTSVSRSSTTGDLWIGTLRGLSCHSGGTLRSYRQTDSGLMNDVIYQVIADGPLVWCGTASGLSCLDTTSGVWTLHDVKNSIMHEPWCYSVAVGPQRTWIAIWGGGIVELDRRTGLFKEYRDPDGEMEIDLLRDDGPIHDVSSFVAWDGGFLWQASYFGLARYDGRRWRSFTAADSGLPGDFISHVSSRGPTVWIGSDQGLGVLEGDTCVSYRRSKDGGCDMRVCRDGKEIEVRHLATAPADDYVLWTQGGESDVWFATGRGLSHGIAERKASAEQRKDR